MRILVTGGAGFIGRHLCHRLHDEGRDLVVVDSLDPQVHGHVISDIVAPFPVKRCHAGDLRVPFLKNFTHVIHLAAQVGVGQSMYQPGRYVRQNTEETSTLMQMIGRAEAAERVLVASSMSVYGEGAYRCSCRIGAHYVYPETNNARRFEMPCPDCGAQMVPVLIQEDMPMHPTSVYGITKRDQEELTLTMCAAYGIPAMALRFFNVYGPGQALTNPYTGAAAIFANRIMNCEAPIVFEDGHQSRDFIYVDDIVDGIVRALDSDRVGPVNLGTGMRTSIAELAFMLQGMLATRGRKVQFTREFREGDIRHGAADTRRAHAWLNWEARVTLRDGMNRTVEWMKERGGSKVESEAEMLRSMGMLRR